MKKNYKHFILGMLIVGSPAVQAVPQQDANADAVNVTSLELQKLLSETETFVKKQQSLYGYRYDASNELYNEKAGLIKEFRGNCDGGAALYAPESLTDNVIDGEIYYTGKDGFVPENMKGQRHWVEMTFPIETNDIVIKYTCIMPQGEAVYGDAPTKIALVAAKDGEIDAWTDTLFIGKSLPTYSTVYSKDNTRENTTYVGHFKLDRAVKNLRFVGLERNNDPKTTSEVDGPYWGLSELRIYDGAEWSAESELYKKVSKSVKENLTKKIADAKQALATDSKDLTAVYTNLENAGMDFKKACDDILKPGLNAFLDTFYNIEDNTNYLEKSQTRFYSYVDNSKFKDINHYIVIANDELFYGGITQKTYKYLKEATESMDAQINPTAALAYWNAYDWDSHGTLIKKPAIKEALDAIANLSVLDFEVWIPAVDKFNNNLKIGYPKPVDGEFFRIVGANNNPVSHGYYLTVNNGNSNNTGNGVRPLLSFKNFGEEEPDESTIIYQANGGQLYGYTHGHILRYAPNSHLFAAVPIDNDELNTGNNMNEMKVVKFDYNVGIWPDGCYRICHSRHYRYGDAFLTRYLDLSVGGNGNHNDPNAQWYIIRVKELPVNVTETKYASVYFPVPVMIPEGVKAYTGSQKDNVFVLNEITSGVIPAHTGAIIIAEQGKYNFKITDAKTPVVDGNELKGQLFTDYAKESVFTLQNGDQGIGLYPFLGKKDYNDGKTNPDTRLVQGFKAFLPQGNLVKGLRFNIQPEQTGIEEVTTPSEKSKVYYDLNGKRVFYPSHGIYITGEGKKVFIR